MERNEITANIRDQEDQAMLPLTVFDKEKFVAMQQQAPEGMTQPWSFQQRLPQCQTNIPKGPMKRQVEAWKNMKSKKMLEGRHMNARITHNRSKNRRSKRNRSKEVKQKETTSKED